MLGHDYVCDTEILYRRVRDVKGNYKYENGVCRISRAAFGDRQMKPSVDRAQLRENNPENSKWEATDLIVCLVTHDVRSIDVLPGRIVDVLYDPIRDHPEEPDNPAHSLVSSNPELLPGATGARSAFDKLKRQLAKRSKWEIGPPDHC